MSEIEAKKAAKRSKAYDKKRKDPYAGAKYELRFHRDINMPWGWAPELPQNPQWKWMSHEWIAAGRVPKINTKDRYGKDLTGSEPEQVLAWDAFVRQVETEDEIPPFNQVHGPFPVYSREDIPPGEFWIGHGANRDHFPLDPGLFAGFRRTGRPKSPWWWEVVYMKVDKRGKLVLHAYQYNYLGMPLTVKRSGWNWRVQESDMLWIADLHDLTTEERVQFWRDRKENLDDAEHEAMYHWHGFWRNILRAWYDLPPFRF